MIIIVSTKLSLLKQSLNAPRLQTKSQEDSARIDDKRLSLMPLELGAKSIRTPKYKGVQDKIL
jgi:hypothetical protein